MTFGAVHSAYLQLKKRLSVHVGPAALAEITIDPPQGSNDELSFLRLVSWAYVILHENGKVCIPFLTQLPPLDRHGNVLPHVRGLRTWMSHNLSLEKAGDIKTIRTAIAWFTKTCGVGSPSTPEHWAECFKQLCSDLVSLLNGAIAACDNFSTKEDGPRLVKDLEARINLQWDAYIFDEYVEKAAERLGYAGFDIVAFRGKHLDSWRKVVALAEDNARVRLLTLKIEEDILSAMASALPITTQEFLEKVPFPEPTQLAAAMILIRSHRTKEGADLPSLLDQIFHELQGESKREDGEAQGAT